jgi:antibiotic biosynthesis monooxygenase (ABM) superfamily enzyme
MSEAPQQLPEPPVTVVISRRVKRGCEPAFEAFLLGVTAACSMFPGYLGSNVFRPVNTDDPEYRIIFKFDRLSNLRHWETSAERQHWFTQAEALTEAPPTIQVLTGLETWFTLPGKASITPPPRYKMALVTWLAIFPLVTAISIVLSGELSHLPIAVRAMVVTAIAVPTMTYLLMPQMTRLFAWWLYPPCPETSQDSSQDSSVDTPSATPSLLASPTQPTSPLAPTLHSEPAPVMLDDRGSIV